MNDYSTYTLNISTEPSYYGSDCSQQDADLIAASLGEMVRAEFPGIQTELHHAGRSSGKTTGPDEVVVDEINTWVGENWTAAL